MALIKNLHILQHLDQQSLDMMEHAAAEHKRYGSLQFKIVEADEKSVVIQITQDKNAAGAYHTKKRLIEIVHETFDRFFTGKKVKVHPIPYQVPAAATVTTEWINKQMLATRTKLKDIALDTGLDYTSLSALVSGIRPLSQTTRAMFYFYFMSKGRS